MEPNNRSSNVEAMQYRQNDIFNWDADYENYRNKFYRDVWCNMCGMLAILIWLLVGVSKSCGGDTKGIVIAALIIKFTFAIPVEWFFMQLIRRKVCKSTTITLLKLLTVFLFVAWYIYITIAFFSSSNDCKDEALALWIAHLLLVIEAFSIFLFVALMLMVFGCVCCCVWMMCCAMREDKKQNIRIKDLILGAASLKLNYDELNSEEICTICIEEFNENDNIIRLPCDQRHLFHASCIGAWIETKTNCPICKAEFNQETLSDLKQNQSVTEEKLEKKGKNEENKDNFD